MIERRRADRLRMPEIVFRAEDGLRADRKAALVRPKDGSPGHAQHQTVDRCRPERQIRMSTAPIGTWVPTNVGGPTPYPEPVFGQRIFDAKSEREGVAWLGMQDVFHHDPVRAALRGSPGCPAHQTVNRVAAFRLVQRELVAKSVELVAAVLQPVRPRDQGLPPTRGAHFVGSVSVDNLPSGGKVRAEAPADRDDNSLLVARCDLNLLA